MAKYAYSATVLIPVAHEFLMAERFADLLPESGDATGPAIAVSAISLARVFDDVMERDESVATNQSPVFEKVIPDAGVGMVAVDEQQVERVAS
jgi:hypothetical protein